jgi:hypothetical protein
MQGLVLHYKNSWLPIIQQEQPMPMNDNTAQISLEMSNKFPYNT